LDLPGSETGRLNGRLGAQTHDLRFRPDAELENARPPNHLKPGQFSAELDMRLVAAGWNGALSVQLAAIWGMSVEIDCNLEAVDGVVSSSPEHCTLGRLLRFRRRCRRKLTPLRRAARVRPVCIDGGIAGVSADAETSRS
jgi:hypothetical protein